MAHKKIETIINDKIHPFTLNEKGKADLAQIIRKYPYDLLVECIDIGVATYFHYDENGKLIQDSVRTFLNKLGGIAYNKSRSPIDQEINHLKNKGQSIFRYWDSKKADELLHLYVKELALYGWSEQMILADLQGESSRMMNNAKNWSTWVDIIEHWINEIKHWSDEDTVTISQSGSVLPIELFNGLPNNVCTLCKQINASYENNLYDCAAVMMRRLLEGLLVLSFQNAGIESEITDKSGKHHISLDNMIKNAEQNSVLALSANTKKDMALFKDLGNYSAHKIWYNCTQSDLRPHILKYRAIIEELMYKSGTKTVS
ncbi:MAG: DUF4145 domain-containing protein [Clostridia bacterium]|nr:DUF4145 domain-containing protein [Clostridia bacterium]